MGEGGREASMCGCLSHAPLLWTWPATQACVLDWELNQQPFGLQAGTQPLSCTSQGYAKLFEKLSDCFLKELHHFPCSPAVYEGSNFSTHLRTLVIIHPFYYSHPGGWEVVSHCGLDLHFPSD